MVREATQMNRGVGFAQNLVTYGVAVCFALLCVLFVVDCFIVLYIYIYYKNLKKEDDFLLMQINFPAKVFFI